MILKLNYHLSVRHPAPKTSVQPEDVIGKHRAGENGPSSQCDTSPRRSPAIYMGSGPGVSQFEMSTEEEGPFPPETSIDGFQHSNFTSPEQKCILLKSDIEVDNNDEASASKVQAGASEESARLPIGQQQEMTAWSTDQNRQFDRGRSRVNSLLSACFPPCALSASYCVFFPSCLQICRNRYERR